MVLVENTDLIKDFESVPQYECIYPGTMNKVVGTELGITKYIKVSELNEVLKKYNLAEIPLKGIDS